MAKITKPEANPILALVLTWFVFGIGHFLINGQQRKWLYTLVATLIGYVLCLLPGIVIAVMSVIDSYMTAARLQKGESIDENEYTFAPLFKIMKMIDKTAVFGGEAGA